jgi:hypothetical protein
MIGQDATQIARNMPIQRCVAMYLLSAREQTEIQVFVFSASLSAHADVRVGAPDCMEKCAIWMRSTQIACKMAVRCTVVGCAGPQVVTLDR